MKQVLSNFKINEKILLIEPYGEGHINDTYLVTCENNKKYILQRINNRVFKDVNGLMNNISLVTSFLKEKIKENNGDPEKETLNIVKTLNDSPYYFDKQTKKYYRVYLFVDGSLTLQKADTKELFKESAIAFGRFQKLLSAFDASLLCETIINFHNTKERYNHFVNTLSLDKCNRAKYCKEEIEFVLKRKDYCSKIVDLIESKKIPLKVTHNDTKLNNVLLNNETKKSLCVIDLDTIMPGSALYDFGDSIRFGCNMGSEDSENLDEVTFSIEYYKAFVEGFLQEVKSSLNKYELEYLSFAAILMTLECGIRFLDDFLDGDNYFKTSKENHNLIRCRTQFKLVFEMEKQLDLMNQIVMDVYKK